MAALWNCRSLNSSFWGLGDEGERGRKALRDPCDYAAEDELAAAWRDLTKRLPTSDLFSVEPGYTGTYSGPGSSTR